MYKTIAVLITCHNRRDKTLACLHSLYNCEFPHDFVFDVFLVDDGSTDGTSEAVTSDYPKVIIINGDGNLYWNRGMYRAWETAINKNQYDFYLWLNDDTYLFKNAIFDLISAAKKIQYQSIIIASTCSSQGNELTYGGFSENGILIVPSNTLIQANTFNGNCVFISKFVFEKVGNIDPLFHHAIGDIDYGLRAVKKGIKSYVAPGFLAYCESHETLPQWCLKDVSLKNRIKSLYSPLGNSQPYYFFRFELRHFGLAVAVKHIFSIHLSMLFPQLWKR